MKTKVQNSWGFFKEASQTIARDKHVQDLSTFPMVEGPKVNAVGEKCYPKYKGVQSCLRTIALSVICPKQETEIPGELGEEVSEQKERRRSTNPCNRVVCMHLPSFCLVMASCVSMVCRRW